MVIDPIATMEPLFEQSKAFDLSLQRVVRIREGIRTISDLSRQVNLVALNAMLAAKQSGIQARGFGVVSSELRQFSDQLDLQMQELEHFINSLVHTVANATHIRRQQAHLDKVSAIARAALAGAVARIAARRSLSDQDGSNNWFSLIRRLDHALRLCNTGVALSRAARIEAVYGRTLASSLRQVAEEIETAILAILGTLKQLRSDIAR